MKEGEAYVHLWVFVLEFAEEFSLLGLVTGWLPGSFLSLVELFSWQERGVKEREKERKREREREKEKERRKRESEKEKRKKKERRVC